DAFLERVRQAVKSGNRTGGGALLPRGLAGYQGAGPDPVARFQAECTAAGGQVHVVTDSAAAIAKVVELVKERSVRKALVGQSPLIDTLDLAGPLQLLGIDVVQVEELTLANCREPVFAAGVGITGVDFLVAETGSVVLRARPGEPRSVSLLPP